MFSKRTASTTFNPNTSSVDHYLVDSFPLWIMDGDSPARTRSSERAALETNEGPQSLVGLGHERSPFDAGRMRGISRSNALAFREICCLKRGFEHTLSP
jgi:hypothetical protein